MTTSTIPLRTLALALGVALLAATVPAATVPAAVATAATVPATTTLESVLAAPRLDVAAAGRLYDGALLAGDVGALHGRLDAMAATETRPERRARLLLVKAALYWREGDRTDAAAAAEAAIAAAPSADAYVLRGELAELVDATAAAGWYGKARALAADPAERAPLDLRLAIIDALSHPEGLVDFANAQPVAKRADIAAVLALLGRPAAALDVDRSGGGGTAGLANALRIAEWGAAAGDAATTRDAAWRAYQSATDTRDKRYALSLLIEGYRTAGDMTGARTFLAARPRTPEVEAALIEVLLETGRTPDAVALVRGSRDPELQSRLIGILELTGDADATIAEYRRLIAAAPHDPDNYVGLAATHVGRGDADRARAVFREFFAANRGRTDLLTAVGRQMIAMGLGDDAIALMRSEGSAMAGNVVRLFLFHSYLDQGKEADARVELTALAAGHPSDALLGEIADGYDLLHEPGKALAALGQLERAGPLDYDRQAQAAELAARAGTPEEALRRWLIVWREATLPARRSYAEKQIIALARQTDRLGELARASEARLASGKAQPEEIDFLVSLRLAQDDRAGALAAVRRYAGTSTVRGRADNVETLRRLAQIYARLKDYAALQTTLRQLAAADLANRDDYLRQLTLTVVRYGDVRGPAKREQIDTLLGQFRGAAPDFRAAVYALAGMRGAALDQYRAALAAAPGDGDALSRYADALRKQGGGSQSSALLQFQVETATTDEGYAAALDGMLDLVDPGYRRDAPGPARLAALQWVERRVLERIATSGTDARLTGILVDVAEMLGDMGLEVRTYEASLPTAGGQRPYVLRQLLILSAPEGINGKGKTLNAPERRLRYARRLLALRQPYPPEFYGEIATAMLKQGDRAGAERAFAMMGDGGGLVNVDETRGRAYSAAGLTNPALAAMGLALARDQDNLDLLVDTSILREQNGRSALAFEWYWRGLARTIARQAEGARNDADQRFDARKFLPTLTVGALLNWPTDPVARAKVFRDIKRLFDMATGSVDKAAPGTLIDHARLASIVELGERIRAAGLDDGTVAAWSATLDRLFAADFLYRRDRAYFRDLQGQAANDAPGWDDRVAAELFVQARDSGNGALALSLAIGAGDMTMVRAALEGQFRADLAWRDASAKKQGIDGMPPDVSALLANAIDRLSAEQIRGAVARVIADMPNGEIALFDLYRARENSYRRLADALGHQPIADARLMDLLNTRASDPIGWSGALGVYWGGDWTPGSFTTAQQLDLFDRLTARTENGNRPSPLATGVLRGLLTHPLDPAQSERLAAILKRDVAFIRDPAKRSVVDVLPHLLMPETLAANRPLLLTAVDQATRVYPDAGEIGQVLTNWFAGRQDEALRHLDVLEGALAGEAKLEKAIETFRNRQLAEIRKREIDAVMTVAHPSPDAIAAFYKDIVVGAAGSLSPRQSIDFARRLVALDPDRPEYLVNLVEGYRSRDDLALLAPMLQAYVDRHVGDLRAATALALTYRLLGRTAEADAVARRSGVKIDDARWIVAQSAGAEGEGEGTAFAELLDGMYFRYASTFPDDAVVREVARLQGRSGGEPDALATLIEHLVAAQRLNPATVPGVLRGWWRANAGDPSSSMGPIERLVSRIGAGNEPALSVIFARPDVIDELSRYLTTLSAEDRHASQPLYDLIARGDIAGGRATARVAELTASLRAGDIDSDRLQHLATLADLAGVPLDTATVAALVAQLDRSPALAMGERVHLAGVLVRSAQQAATRLLIAALDQTANPFTPLDRDGDTGTIVASLTRWPDRAMARQAHEALARHATALTAADPSNILELPPLDMGEKP